MHEFCTIFDMRYAPRGLAMIASLQSVLPGARVHVLCLDEDVCAEIVRRNATNVVPVPLSRLEEALPALREVRLTRSYVEYLFTLTPCWPLYLLETVGGMEAVTWVDADLFFFSSPEALLAPMKEYHVSLIEHRFAPGLEWMERNGRFNVGWMTFCGTEEGRRVLAWWREQCLAWCYDRHEGGRYADQKYLDAVPEMFSGVYCIDHPGANLAPWNLGRHRVTVSDGRVLAGGQPLVFYHFHGLRRIHGEQYDLNLRSYGVEVTPEVIDVIYGPYVRALRATGLPVVSAAPRHSGGLVIRTLKRWVRALQRRLGCWCGGYVRFEQKEGAGGQDGHL